MIFLAILNPFLIPFPEKADLTNEDYIEIQALLRDVNIEPLLELLHPNLPSYTGLPDFRNRCSRGRDQILIDPERGCYPERHLVKIGNGGNNCVVCCVPFQGKYPEYVKSIIQGLQEQNYNGYYFYMIGGYPNPTGKEIRYVAVPYCFKIFMMLEAYKLGFNRVLWVDSACYPVMNIDCLFDVIEQRGALLNCWEGLSYLDAFILPYTFYLLKYLTGTDVLRSHYVNTSVFGFKMDSPDVQEVIKTYYEFAEMGEPREIA